MSAFAIDGHFWRSVAASIARSGPRWFLRYSPQVAGAVVTAASPKIRKNVVSNLHLIRGEKGALADTVDAMKTVGSYASCLADVLAAGSKNEVRPDTVLVGRRHVDHVLKPQGGVILATIHSGGWDLMGPLFANYRRAEVVLVMEGERDSKARELQDEARRKSGLTMVHVGDDPLSSLPLLRHLRDGNVVALQIDRVPRGMKSVRVRLFDQEGVMPLGPLRLAQASGAPLVPIFCARTGPNKYVIEAYPAVLLPRRASAEEIERAAQKVADAMTSFLRDHPTQWFHFGH